MADVLGDEFNFVVAEIDRNNAYFIRDKMHRNLSDLVIH